MCLSEVAVKETEEFLTCMNSDVNLTDDEFQDDDILDDDEFIIVREEESINIDDSQFTYYFNRKHWNTDDEIQLSAYG